MLRSSTTSETQDSFRIKEKTFTQQYSGVYFTRINVLRSRFTDLWDINFVSRLIQIKPNVDCYIIGTLYIDMPLKPTILSEITREQWVDAPPALEKYVSEKDVFILEDESGRVKLDAEILKQALVMTGMVLALRGFENSHGTFTVTDYRFPSARIQKPISCEDKFVALVSGLEFGKQQDLRYDLLLDYLTGCSGDSEEQLFNQKITRLIVCGNSISNSNTERVKTKFGNDHVTYDPMPLSSCDEWLATLCLSIDVDVLPGGCDPTSSLLPQPPIHPSMFQQASQYNTFQCLSNPASFQLDGTDVFATTGKTLDTISKYVNGEDRLQMAQVTLNACHYAPLAPDLLWCHPFKDIDPFIIETRPHIYAIGNQPLYQTKLVETPNDKTRIVLVPKFSETGTIVLVNLRTLEAQPVVFKGEIQ